MPDAAGRASYLAYRAGAEIARALPPALALPIARAASRGMTRVWRGRHDEVERNVRRVLGAEASEREVRDATAEVFANYARYWQEMFRLSRERPDSFDARVDDEGYEHVVEACDAGRGAILALPHLGNWDLAGAWMAARGHGVTVVAEPVHPRGAVRLVRRRARQGRHGGRRARPGLRLPAAARALRQPHRGARLRSRPVTDRGDDRLLRRAHDDAGRPGHARVADGRAAPAGRCVLPARRPPPDPDPAAGAG